MSNNDIHITNHQRDRSQPQPNGSSGCVKQEAILADYAFEIRELGNRVVADIAEIGRRLTECKKIVGHGNWLMWLDQEFGWSEQTALNFMRLHELGQTKSKKLLDFNLSISSLYILAAPSTDQHARDEIIQRAESGEVISYAKVKESIAKARKRKSAGSKAPAADDAMTSQTEETTTAPLADASTSDAVELLAASIDDNEFDSSLDRDESDPVLEPAPTLKRLSRPAQWARAAAIAAEALHELQDLQEQYSDWQGSLPDNLQDSATAEKLETVCDLDIAAALEVVEQAEALDLPVGFGRD